MSGVLCELAKSSPTGFTEASYRGTTAQKQVHGDI